MLNRIIKELNKVNDNDLTQLADEVKKLADSTKQSIQYRSKSSSDRDLAVDLSNSSDLALKDIMPEDVVRLLSVVLSILKEQEQKEEIALTETAQTSLLDKLTKLKSIYIGLRTSLPHLLISPNSPAEIPDVSQKLESLIEKVRETEVQKEKRAIDSRVLMDYRDKVLKLVDKVAQLIQQRIGELNRQIGNIDKKISAAIAVSDSPEQASLKNQKENLQRDLPIKPLTEAREALLGLKNSSQFDDVESLEKLVSNTELAYQILQKNSEFTAVNMTGVKDQLNELKQSPQSEVKPAPQPAPVSEKTEKASLLAANDIAKLERLKVIIDWSYKTLGDEIVRKQGKTLAAYGSRNVNKIKRMENVRADLEVLKEDLENKDMLLAARIKLVKDKLMDGKDLNPKDPNNTSFSKNIRQAAALKTSRKFGGLFDNKAQPMYIRISYKVLSLLERELAPEPAPEPVLVVHARPATGKKAH